MALDPFFWVKFNGFSGPGDSFEAVFWLLGHAIDSINMVEGCRGLMDPCSTIRK